MQLRLYTVHRWKRARFPGLGQLALWLREDLNLGRGSTAEQKCATRFKDELHLCRALDASAVFTARLSKSTRWQHSSSSASVIRLVWVHQEYSNIDQREHIIEESG